MKRFRVYFKGRYKYCLVDSNWYEMLKYVRWTEKNGWYVFNGNYAISRVILDAKPGELVDHINMNPLDNRMSNLRIVTKQQNSFNMRKRHKNTSSKYKCVSWRPDRNKWRAYIVKNNKQYALGHFDSEIKAARAYDKAAIDFFGDYAKLNFESSRIKR